MRHSLLLLLFLLSHTAGSAQTRQCIDSCTEAAEGTTQARRPSFAAMARYYRRADRQVQRWGYHTPYFGLAVHVVSTRGIGLARYDILHLVLQRKAYRFLRSAGHLALAHNACMLDSLCRGLPPDTTEPALTTYLLAQEQYVLQRHLMAMPDGA